MAIQPYVLCLPDPDEPGELTQQGGVALEPRSSGRESWTGEGHGYL